MWKSSINFIVSDMGERGNTIKITECSLKINLMIPLPGLNSLPQSFTCLAQETEVSTFKCTLFLKNNINIPM